MSPMPGGPGGRLPEIDASLRGDTLTLRIDPDTIPTDDVLHITPGGSQSSGVSSLQVDFSSER